MITLSIETVIPLISAILYIFILVIISTSNVTRLSKAFRYYIISMIIWSIGSFLMKTEVPPSPLFWNKYVTQLGFNLVPVFLLQFSYVLINISGKKQLLKLAYAGSFILIIMSYAGFVISDAWLVNGAFEYTLSWGAYIVAVVASSISIGAFFMMVRAVKDKQVSLKKVQLVIFGIGLVIIGGALNISETFGRLGVDIIFNAISAVLITYSIYRNKFLEINLIVKKGLYFSIYNFSLFAVYASIIIVLYNYLDDYVANNSSIIIIIMGPMFLILEPVRKLLEKLTNDLFYRATSDRQIVLNSFSNLVNTTFSLEKINSSLLDAIQQGMESKEVSILLKNSNKYKLHETSIEGLLFSETYISFKHPIVDWLKENKSILLGSQIDNDVMFKSLWDAEKRVIANLQTEVIVPINYLDEIIGLVIISGRVDELPYSDLEIQFLKTLLNNAAAIIENAKTIDMLKTQSVTDELTKLYNHRFFHDTVGDFVKNKTHSRYSVAMVDIDQFKIYNDLYGHKAGDKALQKIAQIIIDNVPKNALPVRYGGEEFGIYLPEFGPIETQKAIDEIRKAVEESFLLSTDIREFLTVSVGASCYPNHGSNLETILSNAFIAINDCKNSGRNKSIVYNEKIQVADEISKTVQEKIKEAYLSSTYALAATIDAKDHYTYGHSNNVAELCVALAKEANFVGEDLEIIKSAGLLHDIGKVGIPESVLLKKGYLTDKEMEIMRSHVIQSINIIKHIPNLIDTIPIIISHHERFDGNGYPRGISGENIPILGRVICIADAFDAMTTDRPYRKGLALDQALYELKKHAGTQFDPVLVNQFINLVNRGDLAILKLENRPSF